MKKNFREKKAESFKIKIVERNNRFSSKFQEKAVQALKYKLYISRNQKKKQTISN